MSIVLSQADLDYSGMKKIGRVTISDNGDRVWIQVDGFEFDDLPTCRMQSARVIAWARDLLSAQLEAERFAPGGQYRELYRASSRGIRGRNEGRSGGLNSDGAFYFQSRAILEIAVLFISTCGNKTLSFASVESLEVDLSLDHKSERDNLQRFEGRDV